MDHLKSLIREVPDFPKPGINFYDITTLLKHPEGLRSTVDALAAEFEGEKIDSVIGIEAREQMLARIGQLPDAVLASVGGGSNAIGIFHPFTADEGVELIGIEAAGHGIDSGAHAATICAGREGILHGSRSMVLQNEDGQVIETHSISAGLDYPGVGPEHAWLNDVGRVQFLSATDDEAVAAFQLCSKLEGIIPALEPAHALARVLDLAPQKPKSHLMVINLSGRGDKDLDSVASYLSAKSRGAN